MAVEVKKVYQHSKTKLRGNKRTISNGYFFKDLSNVQLNWEVIEDGRLIEKGEEKNLSLAPQQNATLSLPVKTKQKPGKEYFLNVGYTLKEAEPFWRKATRLLTNSLL